MDHRSRQEFLRLANFEKKFKNFNLKSLITDHRIKCHATMSNIYLFTCYEIFSLMLRSYEILFFLPWIFHSNLVFSCYIEYKDLLVICSKRATICFVATMYLAIHNWPYKIAWNKMQFQIYFHLIVRCLFCITSEVTQNANK